MALEYLVAGAVYRVLNLMGLYAAYMISLLMKA